MHKQPGPWDHYEATEEDRRAWVVSGDEFADAAPTGWDNNSTEELELDEEVLHRVCFVPHRVCFVHLCPSHCDVVRRLGLGICPSTSHSHTHTLTHMPYHLYLL